MSTQAPDCPPENSRSTWNIVWSSATVIFACTWISVHSNVPAVGEGWFTLAKRRFFLMCWALAAPELVLLWATRQWFGSRDIAHKYKDRGWTKLHGFFLLMGGFVTQDSETGAIHALADVKFEELLLDHAIDFPDVTKEDIADRSKGDGLAKGFVMLQTTWFIAQCIARAAMHLPISELEVITVAFAMLNGAMYFLWWNKPLDVQSPIRLVVAVGRRNSTASDVLTETEVKADRDASEPLLEEEPLTGGVDELPPPVTDPSPAERPSRREALHNTKAGLSGALTDFLAAASPAVKAIMHAFHDILGCDTVSPNAARVPSFYSPTITKLEQAYIDCGIPFLGTIFGGIHCFAWNFHFPSHQERVLWQISSLFITAPPFCVFILMGLVTIMRYSPRHSIYVHVRHYISVFTAIMMVLFLIPYILARFCLFVLAFTSLRNLPPGAYQDIQWSTYIPHI